MPRKVLFNVQLLRFIAAFCILFTHIVGLISPASPLVHKLPWVGGVDIFFVISGFIMTWMTSGQFGSPRAAADFLRRRIVRVVPPYWFFTLLTAALVLIIGGRYKSVTAEPVQLLTSLAFIPWPRIDGQLLPILPQGWTLNYEAFFYLAFALCMLLRRGLAFLVTFFVLLSGAALLIPDRWFAARFFADPIILEFVAGIAIGRGYLSGWRIGPWASAGLAAAAIALYFTIPVTNSLFDRPLHLGVPAALLVAALILGREPRQLGWLGRAIKLGGDASYTLYLSHKLVGEAVLMAYLAVGLRSPLLFSIIAIPAALAFAVLFYRYAEAPVLARLGDRLKLRGRQVAAAAAP